MSEDGSNSLGPEVPSDADVPVTLRASFWSLVLLLNLAILGLSVGAMLVWFRGQWDLGGALFAAGALTLGLAVYRYRTITADPPWEDASSE